VRRRALTIAAVAGGHGALLVALFWRVWLRGEMSGWDCAVEYWPDLIFQVKSIGSGHWPGWNPYVLGGYPYWADPQAGLYAPASWLTWPLAAIGGDGPWLIQTKVLVNLWLGLCGMHAWSWWRTRSHAAATVAALVFVLGSPLLVHKNGALLWPVLYWPWALLALERFVAAPTPRRAVLLAGAVWLVGTAGHPQTFFYGLVVLAIDWAFLTVTVDGPGRAHHALRRQLPAGALAIGLAALLLAATWVPAWSAVESSPRAHRGLGYVLGVPLAPAQLRELLVPNLDTNWQADVYVGPLALVGALWLCARRRASAILWCGVGLFGLLLALGAHGHVLPWLAQHVPGFGLFRIAYRHKLIFGVAAAVLAGDAIAALAAGEVARRWRLVWIGLGAAWLALAAATGFRAWPCALAAAMLAIAGALPWLAGRARAAALVGLPLIVLVDLWSAGLTKLDILQRRPDPAQAAAIVAPMAGIDRAWRYDVGDMRTPYGGTVPFHAPVLLGVREESGYSNPIEPARHAELERRARQSPDLLRHFNVKYFAGHSPLPADARAIAPRIAEVDDVAPVARWYPRAEVHTAGEILEILATQRPSQLPAALVEAEDVRGLELPASAGASPAASVDAALVRFEPDQLAIDVDAPAPGVLVVAEAFAPGWRATVEGRDAPVFRAQYHQRAVIVPAGRSRVVLRYQPRGRLALPLLFVLGLIGSIALLALRMPWLDREVRA